MRLDFIPVLFAIIAFSFISSVSCKDANQRKMPIEGSGSGLGPGVDDEDRVQPGGAQLKKAPKGIQPKANPQPYLPPVSPSDRFGRPAKRPLPEQKRPVLPPVLPGRQQGDEGSGLPPDQERALQPQMKPGAGWVPKKAQQPVPLPTLAKERATLQGRPSLMGGSLSCKETLRLNLRKHYLPKCDAYGNFEPRQCNQDDCMCVDRRTGIVLEKTVALKVKNISCHEVKYVVQLPLRNRQSPFADQSPIVKQVLQQLEQLLDNLPGQQKFSFQRYLPDQESARTGLEFLCSSIGHSDSRALRGFLEALLDKGSLGQFIGSAHLLNVSRLPSGRDSGGQLLLGPRDTPAVKAGDAGSPSGDLPKYNAGKDTPEDEADPISPRNDEGQNSGAMGQKKKSVTAAFLQQPGIIAAIIGGGIAGFLLAILLILFCIYRIRKKDEGSYALEEPKKMPVSAAVYQSAPTREYYA